MTEEHLLLTHWRNFLPLRWWAAALSTWLTGTSDLDVEKSISKTSRVALPPVHTNSLQHAADDDEHVVAHEDHEEVVEHRLGRRLPAPDHPQPGRVHHQPQRRRQQDHVVEHGGLFESCNSEEENNSKRNS